MPSVQLLGALLMVVALAACGSARPVPVIGPAPRATGPADSVDLRAVRAAARHTLTLRAEVSLVFASPSSLALPPILASGTFDLRRAAGEELVRDPSGPEALLFLPGGVFDRPSPQDAVALPRGRPWIRADFNERIKGALLPQFLLRAAGRDPGFLLAEVAWGAQAAAPLGRHVIAGRAATGYLVQVNSARAARNAAGPRAQGFVRTVAFVRQAVGAGSEAATQIIRLWVDRSHRVVSLRTSPVGSGIGTTLMTVTAFGVPVDPSPPRRSETIDLAALTPAGDLDRD